MRVLRFAGRLAKWITVGFLLALVGTSIYGRVLHRRDAARWKPPGKLLDVGAGRRMHIYCTGSGSPTIILEAGLGDFSLSSWGNIQPRIAEVSRTCAYDRAWTGWSDPSSEKPTPTHIVNDLHTLLAASGEPGPYLFVGHSLGGPIIRDYFYRYPSQVAGLVLVDGSHDEQLDRMKGMPTWVDWLYRAFPAIHFLGLDRSAAQLGVTDSLSAITAAFTTSDHGMENTTEIARHLREFFAEVKQDAKPFGDVPVTALTAGKMVIPSVPPARADTIHAEWVKMHQEYAAQSTRGKWVLAKESQHYIQRDQPDLVLDAIRAMVQLIRAPKP